MFTENSRERCLRIMNFEKCGWTMLWEFGYWAGTIKRWYKEGLPRRKGIPGHIADGVSVAGEGIASPEFDFPVDSDVHDYFGFDKGITKVPVNNWVFPPFEERIIQEDNETITVVDDMGVKKKDRKDHLSMPIYLDWPVKNRQDFETIKERFVPKLEGRVPNNWAELIREYRNRDYPLSLGGIPFGFFGSVRYLMGFVNLCVAYHEDPQLIKDILSFLTDFWIELWSQILPEIEVDFLNIWEDMCYKTGPLISPEMFREFMMLPYKKIINFVKDFGVKHIFVDSDGDVRKLIPAFIECGVTGIFPLEVNAGMDVISIRKEFPRLQMMGGLDKTAIAKGKEYIDKEVETKLSFMLRRGGYIPTTDHLVPPDVLWENYVYYRGRIKEMVKRLSNSCD